MSGASWTSKSPVMLHSHAVAQLRPAPLPIRPVRPVALQQSLAFSASPALSSSYGNSLAGCQLPALPRISSMQRGRCTREVTRMGNKSTGGPFAPIVVVTRNVMGKKEFNQFRGKAISLHSQIIKDFGKSIGVDSRQIQGLIKLAKKNGEKLGFLA